MLFNILSVDWDYFFPDPTMYDWGHRENLFFINDIWYMRTNHVNLKTGESVIDCHLPVNYETFWERTIKKVPDFLAISESHSNLYSIIDTLASSVDLLKDPIENIAVYNFDAHHDLGYGECPDNIVDCANWAQRVLEFDFLDEYHIIYPDWRKSNREDYKRIDELKLLYDVNLYYSPPRLPLFDMVFICRSGAWTPAWHDDHWLNFISWWQKHERTWNNKKLFHNPLKPRKPNLIEARECRLQLKELIQRNIN